MKLPTIHKGGTSKDGLLELYYEARGAINDAIAAVQFAAPNGRDYLFEDRAIVEAVKEHVARIEALERVRDELTLIIDHISEQEG